VRLSDERERGVSQMNVPMMSPSRLARQREIIEVVLSHGWDYMRQLLVGGKTDEPEIPPRSFG
jgi:hypothetical protein